MAQIKPFLKCVNYNHVMPTRYALDVELKSIVTSDVVSGSNPTARQNSRKEVKKILEDKRARTVEQSARGDCYLRPVATVTAGRGSLATCLPVAWPRLLIPSHRDRAVATLPTLSHHSALPLACPPHRTAPGPDLSDET